MSGTFGDADVHATMVLDRVRVDAYARAIARVVRPGDVVVDVGAGSGLLALLAARAGARRVYAIERGPMVELLARTIEENDATGVVEVVFGDAREVEFPEPPIVIVSETLGSLGIDEDCLGLLMAVRAVCAPGCVVIPASVEVVLAPLAHAGLAGERAALAPLSDIHGVRLESLRRRTLARPLPRRITPHDIVGAEVVAGFVVGRDNAPAVISGVSIATVDARVNAIGGWFRSELAPGVSLSDAPDAPETCWKPFVLPLREPLAVRAGDPITLEWRTRVVGNPGTWAWRASCGAEVRDGDALGSV